MIGYLIAASIGAAFGMLLHGILVVAARSDEKRPQPKEETWNSTNYHNTSH